VLSARGEAADLIRGAKAGLVVPPENAKELAAAFELLRRDPAMRARLGAAGRALAERQFGRDDAIERWEGVLREAVAVRGLRT
jgi:glycosyltransferase involved in cell wall biosynthesis